jgi:alpha-tubulin suppressor-like RCC1 family protein
MDSVVQMSLFSNHALFLMEDGTVLAVGLNNYGQLGDGTFDPARTPIMVYQNDP